MIFLSRCFRIARNTSGLLFGGLNRSDKVARISAMHGDVAVWGGPARLRYHGVMPLKEGHHPLVGDHRSNLKFRKAA